MRRVVAVAVLLLALATAALASETDWRVRVLLEDVGGTHGFPLLVLGVNPNAEDNLDSEDGTPWGFPVGDTSVLALADIPGLPGLYQKNFQAPGAPPKFWEFYAAAGSRCTVTGLRLQLRAIGLSVLPPPAWQGTAVRYYIKMLDNRGVAGAPANGTIWDVPIPTSIDPITLWTIPSNLPAIKLSATNAATMRAEGYRFQFVQAPVPEPSSLLALASGLSALVGYALRRRKAQ